jgi:hypothetical protein
MEQRLTGSCRPTCGLAHKRVRFALLERPRTLLDGLLA